MINILKKTSKTQFENLKTYKTKKNPRKSLRRIAWIDALK